MAEPDITGVGVLTLVRCTKCGENKPPMAFYADKRLNKLRTHCKACIPQGKRTPKQRAQYRRRRGEV